MGKSKEPKKSALELASEQAMVARHDGWVCARALRPSRTAQIMSLAEFLAIVGVFDRWVQQRPLHDMSPNASNPLNLSHHPLYAMCG